MNLKKLLAGILLLLPFVLGTLGYMEAGCNVTDALYATLCLYVINPASDEINLLIEIARWTGPLATAGGVLLALQGVWQRFRDRIRGMHKDAVAVYCEEDQPIGETFAGKLKHGILVTDGKVRKAPQQILLYRNDLDNLNLYHENAAFFESRKVYMRLENTDSFLLKKSKINFFSAGEIIAREYWRKYDLTPYLQADSMKVNIAIIGFGTMGRRILNYGLQSNLYRLNQEITYHVWGDSTLYRNSYAGFRMMNGDRIVFHDAGWERDLSILPEMDRIIVTDTDNLTLLQEILGKCVSGEIHYYCPGEALLSEIFANDRFCCFGREKEVLTPEQVRSDSTYHFAKEINYQYALTYGNGAAPQDDKAKEAAMTEAWEELNGFTKGSNLAAADYHEIRLKILKRMAQLGMKCTREQLCEEEHIRWCRFHYLNHWKYGVPDSYHDPDPAKRKNKDPEKKIHMFLVPFADLSEQEKQKDWANIEVLLALKDGGIDWKSILKKEEEEQK